MAGGQVGKEPGGQWHWIRRGLQEVFGINSFLFLIFVLLIDVSFLGPSSWGLTILLLFFTKNQLLLW